MARRQEVRDGWNENGYKETKEKGEGRKRTRRIKGKERNEKKREYRRENGKGNVEKRIWERERRGRKETRGKET